jgi:hypothetical protein
MLLQHGHKVSHSAVARYKRLSLIPAMQSAAKLQSLQSAELNQHDQRAGATSLTHQMLAANPMLERLQRKYGRYDRVIAETLEREEFTAAAAWDNAETKTMRLEAELTGMLTGATPSTFVQIVIGGNAGESSACDGVTDVTDSVADMTIDIAPVRDS